MPNELMPSQLLAPPRTTPMPGISTMISKKQNSSAILLYFFQTRKSIFDVKYMAASPRQAKTADASQNKTYRHSHEKRGRSLHCIP